MVRIGFLETHPRMPSKDHLEFWGLMRALLELPQYYPIPSGIGWDTDQNLSGATQLADENNTACIFITFLKMFCQSASHYSVFHPLMVEVSCVLFLTHPVWIAQNQITHNCTISLVMNKLNMLSQLSQLIMDGFFSYVTGIKRKLSLRKWSTCSSVISWSGSTALFLRRMEDLIFV